jgi:carboxyl-terminal processing protease
MRDEEKMRKQPIAWRTVFMTAAVTFILTGALPYLLLWKKYDLLTELDFVVKGNYYGDVDAQSVQDNILKGYMYGLDDPYAWYYNEEEYAHKTQEDSGNLVGIGVSVEYSQDGYVRILEAMPGSPASEAGFMSGDLITAVDGVDLSETEDPVSLIRGEAGTQLTVTVERDGEEDNYELTRRSISLVSAGGEMLDGQIGYVYINSFEGNTGRQFNDAVDILIEDGAKGIVVDVRNNGGGLVQAAEACLDPLLPEGDIAIATYKNGRTEVLCRSDANMIDIPMAVLINGASASAAELFAAALRDFNGVKLVGTKSFGKGIMQQDHILSKGTVKFTVATYQTTKSECYHNIGLTPDCEVSLPEHIEGEVRPKERSDDTQLQKAVELLTAEL